MKYFESLRRLITENQRQLKLLLVHIFTGTQGTNNTKAGKLFYLSFNRKFLDFKFYPKFNGKISAEPSSSLCIQFVDKEHDGETIDCV